MYWQTVVMGQKPFELISRSNGSKPWPVDWRLYKERHLVECFFQKLKCFRRITARYDKLDASFCALLPGPIHREVQSGPQVPELNAVGQSPASSRAVGSRLKLRAGGFTADISPLFGVSFKFIKFLPPCLTYNRELDYSMFCVSGAEWRS